MRHTMSGSHYLMCFTKLCMNKPKDANYREESRTIQVRATLPGTPYLPTLIGGEPLQYVFFSLVLTLNIQILRTLPILSLGVKILVDSLFIGYGFTCVLVGMIFFP
ncbi:hypothetical protein PanWU01x14_272150 [Parasponia andersonii]|uniref:Transmembrane protein n=1 Tax=Parasponia andersonii TaxID=3476 RepID=A0A2P5B4H6_PARAD|nr:hypothetical protein PanWU01x14_272150 [Parasponia andersonii]